MNDTVEKKVKQTASEAAERAEESSTKAAEDLHDCQAKIIAATQANINAMFEYAQEALKAVRWRAVSHLRSPVPGW